MCGALSVSPSGYYAWRSRPDSLRKIANRDLLADIRRVHAQHQERYGAPRVHAELRAEGQTVSRKRVERVMSVFAPLRAKPRLSYWVEAA
jgi:putative transposase